VKPKRQASEAELRFLARLCRLCPRRRPLTLEGCGFFGAACTIPSTVVRTTREETRLEREAKKLAIEMGLRSE
jgi:hypothetical protein